MTLRVAFIDDHDIVRSGFVQLLSLEADIQVVGEFSSAAQARGGLPGLEADVCICDISMPDGSGLDLLADIPSGIRVVMLSMHDNPALVELALSRGASGFLSKRCKPEDLITAVRTVAGGGVYLTPDIARQLARQSVDPLTRREREIALLLAQGQAVREIAAALGLSPKTVHAHRANLFAKLGVSNNVELAQRMLKPVIAGAALFFIYAASVFCLWGIGAALIDPPWQALLLFPFGLRMGILLQSPRRYWPGILLADVLLILLLADQFGATRALWASLTVLALTVLLSCAASPWLLRHQQSDSEWRWPLQQGAVLALAAVLQAAVWQLFSGDGARALLLGLTGGFTIAPTCLLLWHYLARQIWVPLEPGLIHKPVRLRLRHLAMYLLLFALSIWLQQQVNVAELRRFAPFCLAIPIVFMAYRYGWQGALLATLLNGVVLMAGEPPRPDAHRDLLLSLLAQSLTGLLLGAGIQRQRELNQQLRRRLAENRQLARALVTAEERTRREVARELHDEVGQNVTVIRTQASIVKRLAPQPQVQACADTIDALALRVYDGVHDVLAQLWPAALNNLPLSAAVAAMLRDQLPQDDSVTGVLLWQVPEPALDDTLKITLYRICQEGVTNVRRHADASRIELTARLHTPADGQAQVELTLRDNGVGIDLARHEPGYGLRGMRERVSALGGTLRLTVEQGVCLHVILPTVSPEKLQN